jgi:hypothetical protein
MPTPHTVCGGVNGGVCRTVSSRARGAVVRLSFVPPHQIAHEFIIELIFGPLIGVTLRLGKGKVVFV